MNTIDWPRWDTIGIISYELLSDVFGYNSEFNINIALNALGKHTNGRLKSVILWQNIRNNKCPEQRVETVIRKDGTETRIKLTHWGRVTHVCVSKLTIIGSDNGLSPGRCQAIIWTNAGILLIEPLEANFSEILIEILTFSIQENAV